MSLKQGERGGSSEEFRDRDVKWNGHISGIKIASLKLAIEKLWYLTIKVL